MAHSKHFNSIMSGYLNHIKNKNLSCIFLYIRVKSKETFQYETQCTLKVLIDFCQSKFSTWSFVYKTFWYSIIISVIVKCQLKWTSEVRRVPISIWFFLLLITLYVTQHYVRIFRYLCTNWLINCSVHLQIRLNM